MKKEQITIPSFEYDALELSPSQQQYHQGYYICTRESL